MSGEVEKIAAGLSCRAKSALLNAYTISGPSGDTFVNSQQDFDALYYEQDGEPMVTPAGRILPLGLAVRNHLRTHKGESA